MFCEWPKVARRDGPLSCILFDPPVLANTLLKVNGVFHVNQLKGYYASSNWHFVLNGRRMRVGQHLFSLLLARYFLWFSACVPDLTYLLVIQPPTIAPIKAIWASSLLGNISQTMHWKLMNTCRHVRPSAFHVHTESQIISLCGSAAALVSLPVLVEINKLLDVFENPAKSV